MAMRDVTVHGPHGEREQVEEMLRHRAPFDSIEAFIDTANLDPDTKSALWLLAWSEQGQQKRRGIINEALTATAQPQG